MAGKSLAGLLIAVVVTILVAGITHADPLPSGDVVISTDTAWPEGAYSLNSLTVNSGATLTVAGGSTVTVAGTVQVTGSSTILLQGKNTTDKVDGNWQGVGGMVTAATVQVDAGSRISADGQGYVTGAGPGGPTTSPDDASVGGSSGGRGGGASGPVYGSAREPTDLGSAGGGSYGGTCAGGGAIRLVVTGTLTLNGTISANGTNSGNGYTGGGAGGSVWVTVDTIAGSGTITARGSHGSNSEGGGGRIAVSYQTTSGFKLTSITARPGANEYGETRAAPGTVYLLENGNRLNVATTLTFPPDSTLSWEYVTVSDGALFALAGGSTLTVTKKLTVTGNSTLLVQARNTTGQVDGRWQGSGATINAVDVQVDSGSRISADGQGYVTGAGPGGPTTSPDDALSGGSYGGRGGGASGAVYGSAREPADLGSGGGGSYGGTCTGGGAIRLIVTGTLTLNGTISANGTNSGNGYTGGGAGGSLWMTVDTMAGSGVITASGSRGSNAEGGGGRIAVYYRTASGFNLTAITASAGGSRATPGTVYLLENGNRLNVATTLTFPPDSTLSWEYVTVSDGALFALAGGSTLTVTKKLTVTGNSTLLVQAKNNADKVDGRWQGSGATVNAVDVQVDSGSRISADGQGYVTGAGPGGPATSPDDASAGGSSGGRGGGASGPVYGSAPEPADLGSGGGGSYGGTCAGGGAIRLVVTGTLTVNGTISANGTNSGNGYTGGGAGGSIWVTVDTMAGSGAITASGSRGSNSDGGGGRIAVYYRTAGGFKLTSITASPGGDRAAHGTVYLLENGNRLNVATTLTFPPDATLSWEYVTVSDGALFALAGGSTLTVTKKLAVTGNSTLLVQAKNTAGTVDGRWQGSGATINAVDVQVDSGSRISADGQGYGTGVGPGGPANGSDASIGGSYGGRGGGASGPVYGSAREPADLGSGGGGSYGGTCTGGGAIRLVVTGTLSLDGTISANGANSGNGYTGGGAGGSVWMTVDTMAGSGTITANGSKGSNAEGGGGRVALHYSANTGFNLNRVTALPGGTGAAAGTAYLLEQERHLHVTTNLYVPEETTYSFGTVTLTNGSLLILMGGSNLSGDSITVSENSTIQVQSKNSSGLSSGQWLGAGASLTATALQVDSGSSITADGQGYGTSTGPGAAAAGDVSAGGSYGGRGTGASGPIYGTADVPYDLGSGGGGSYGGWSRGGGAIRLVVYGTLTVNGTISANGQTSPFAYHGGASGGSIFAAVGTLAGNGQITANGNAGSHGSGGGGRVALYYAANSGYDLSAVTAKGGGSGSGAAHDGTVVTSDTPHFFWVKPAGDTVHGSVRLEWLATAVDVRTTTVDITAASNGRDYTLGSRLPSLSGMEWDSRGVPDGRYELRLLFRDGAGVVIGEATRKVLVLNGVLWHSGTVSGDESWGSSTVHVIEGTVVIAAGVRVTVQPGTVIKAVRGARIIIEDGGILDAQGTDQSRIIFTALDDDSAGGDTNLDGDQTKPVPGAWSGYSVQGSGQLSRNASTDLRYLQMVRSGTLTASETWAGSYLYHITADVVVPDGITLTLEPGAVVKFDAGKGITVQSGGNLVAKGTVPQPIRFTSIRDDSVGGDTNGDGNATAPAASNWRWLSFNGAVGTLDHVVISYAGSTNSAEAALSLSGSAVTIANSEITSGLYVGILVTSGALTVNNTLIADFDRGINALGGQTTIVNSTIDGTKVGVLYHGGAIDLINAIVANSFEKGIWVCCGGPAPVIRHTDVWSPTGVGYSGTPDLTGTNGNISVDPKFRNREHGDFRLNYGSPAIDAADGTAAPETDAAGSPRYDDPRTPNTGIATPGGAFADMGALEFVETAPSDIDLIVTALEAPVTAVAGEQVTLNWTIANKGTAPAVGPWHDTVYLVANPDTNPTEIVAGELLVAQGVLLGPEQSQTVSASVRVPGSSRGPHRWGVRTNSRGDVFEGANSGNNRTLAGATVNLELPAITVDGATVSGQFAGVGQSHWYQLEPGAGRDVSVRLKLAGTTSGTVQLYLGQGYMPDPQHYDLRSAEWNSASASALIAGSTSQTWYLLATAGTLTGATADFTLDAATVAFSLAEVLPGAAGNSGAATFHLTGGGLQQNSLYQIFGLNSFLLTASAVFVKDPANVYATFDLKGVAAGSYGIQVVEGGKTEALQNAVTVTSGTTGQIEYSLEAPSALRVGKTGLVTVSYRNAGATDMVAPLLILTAEGGTLSQRVPECRGCSPAFKTVYQSITDPGCLLGINHEGPAGLLPAGAGGTLTLNLTATQDGDAISMAVMGVTDPRQQVDWPGLKESLRPFFVPADAWEAIYANFTASAGTTIGQFNELLAENATYLSRLGTYESRTSILFNFELLQSGLVEIVTRYSLGAFGRGESHPFDIRGDLSSGLPAIRYPDGVTRQFLTDPEQPNQYLGTIGDYGRLVVNPSDHSWNLTEPDGTVFRFIQGAGAILLDAIEELNGNRTTLTYTNGRVTGVVDAAGDTLTYTYNDQGRITQATDPVGRVTSFSYDASGEHLLSRTDAGGTTGFTYLSGQGAAREHALQSISYPDGTRITFEYDDRGRISRRSSNGGAEAVSYSYGPAGEVTLTDASGHRWLILTDESGTIAGVTDPLGATTHFFYDPEGKYIRKRMPEGATSSLEYDTHGFPVDLQDLSGNRLTAGNAGFRRMKSLTDPLGNTLDFSYDTHFNTTGIRYPDGSTEEARYDPRGNLTQWVNRRGKPIVFAYNEKNVLTRKSYSDGSHLDIGYDSHRNPATLAGSAGATSFSYDDADRLTDITFPNGRSLQYAYDSGGRRSRMTDQSGYAVNYSYDAAGRLADLTDGSGGRIVTYTYDVDGRLTREEMGNGTSAHLAYDQAGRLTRLVNAAPDGTTTSRFDYTYDALGRKTAMTTLEGTWGYGYDAAGQLTSVTLPDGSTLQYAYDAAGNRSRVTTAGGTTTGYTVNSLNQYTTVGDTGYRYDADGNMIARTDGTGSRTYSYDDENRLVAMTAPDGTWSYEYDSLGNRVAATHNGQRREYLIDPLNGGRVVAEYDGTGNLIARYTHGLGLVSSVSAGGASYYHFDGSTNTAQITGPSGAVLNTYAYLPFGEKIRSVETVDSPFTYSGQYGVMDQGNGLYGMTFRWYDPSIGRFIQPDPLGIGGDDANLYRYAHNSPITYFDAPGLAARPTSPTGPIVVTEEEFRREEQKLQKEMEEILKKGDVWEAIKFDSKWHDPKNNQKLFTFRGMTMTGSDLNYYFQGMFFGMRGNSEATLMALVVGWKGVGRPVLHGGKPTLPSRNALIAAHMGWNAHRPPTLSETIRTYVSTVVSRVTNKPKPADPNYKLTVGYGDEGYVAGGVPFVYTVFFENKPAATAAAQKVVITDQLHANLDWSTVELLDIGFNNQTVAIPAGLQSYTGQAGVTTDPNPVRINARLDSATGVVTWTMASIDPVTGDLPEDPYAGFLPPNDATHRGEGFVMFRVRPRALLATGATVTNQARIVFDVNPPIDTNSVTNTLDLSAPSSSVSPLPAITTTSAFTVSWGGSDGESSGIAFYDVYVATDSGPFLLWMAGTTATSGTWTGTIGHSYAFYSVATDHVGHRQAVPTQAQATTTLTASALSGDLNGDSLVDVFDALLALQYAVGLYQPTDVAAFTAAADVAPLDAAGKPKGNSTVDVFDALAILRHAVGLDPW